MGSRSRETKAKRGWKLSNLLKNRSKRRRATIKKLRREGALDVNKLK